MRDMDTELDLKRLNFLIVDGNRHMRSVIKGILRALGAENIGEADDGADALKEMRSFPADIVICETNMSPVDGIEFVRVVRNAHASPNPFVNIIMISAHTEHEKVKAARDAGVNEFLAKPLSTDALYKRIREVITKPRPYVLVGRSYIPERREAQHPFIGSDRRGREMSEREVLEFVESLEAFGA